MNILPHQHWRAIVTLCRFHANSACDPLILVCFYLSRPKAEAPLLTIVLLEPVLVAGDGAPLHSNARPDTSECSHFIKTPALSQLLLIILYKLKLFHFISSDSCCDVRPAAAWMYWLYCDPVLIYAAVNQMLLLKSNPLLVAEASSTIEESPINQVQRIGNGWSRVTTNTATEAAPPAPGSCRVQRPAGRSFAEPSRV